MEGGWRIFDAADFVEFWISVSRDGGNTWEEIGHDRRVGAWQANDIGSKWYWIPGSVTPRTLHIKVDCNIKNDHSLE